MKPIDTRRPSKLDLNAPLLSARRSNLTAMLSLEISRSNSLNNSCHRVPFMWEQTPGKPKDSTTTENVLDYSALPLPKPPPVRCWKSEHDSSHDLDEEEEGDYTDGGGFSDAIDLFSLAGSLNTASDRLYEDDNETDVDGRNGMLSPSFMIERFLPAATALAASSLSALAGDKQVKPLYGSTNIVSTKEGSCAPRVTRETCSSSKGCGLEILFPWRVKHRVCGVKSPVRESHSRLKP